MKRILALALCAACLCSTALAAVSADTVKIGGGNAETVIIGMRGGVTADVALAQDSISRDQSAADIINAARAKGNLIAAVNGGFFNAYYEQSPEDGYGKAARCQVTLVRDGQVVNGGGGQAAVCLGFTRDGKALIDEVGITLYVEHGGRRYPTRGVNYYYPEEPDSLLLFTPEAGADLPVPANAKAAKIVNGRVTELLTSGRMVCAGNTYYFVAGKNMYDRLPAAGEAVTFSTEFDKAAWKDVTTAVACGPWLLRGGKNVFSENAKYPYLAGLKVSETAVAARTSAAILPNGDLMLSACTASPRQITEYLLSLGATDAMLLDGGASSMLYADGKTLRAASRKLNNVIVFYETAQPALSVTVGGAPVQWPGGNEPFIDASNRAMAPLRAVGNALGLSVGWDANAREASFSDGSKTIWFPIGKDVARTSGGGTVKMDTTAVIINGSTYAPVRYLAEFFGHAVDWDGATRTVIIK